MIPTAGTATPGTSEASTWAKFLREAVALQALSCRDAWALTGPEESDVPAPKRCAVVQNVCHQAKEQWKGRGTADCTASEITKRGRTLQVQEPETPKYIEGEA